MRVLFLSLLGLAVSLADTTGTDASNSSSFVMYGPHGEVADQDTPYIWVENDDGIPEKAYMSAPNVSFSSVPTDDLPQLIRFHLFTRRSPSSEGEQLIVGDLEKLQASTFNHSHPTKFLIHGFTNSIRSRAIQEPKAAYMTRGEYNVIGVDWGDLCIGPWYLAAKGNTLQVGSYVGEMVQFLVENGSANYDDIHIIGHSLGAHVSGIAGHSLGEDKVGRITGLDPAGPAYFSTPPEERLDFTDAKFVDAIHTCGGYGVPDLGYMDPIAMADFYPNGGVNIQPGCANIVSWFSLPCSHRKAFTLWTDTIVHPRHEKFHCFGCTSLESVKKGCQASGVGGMGEDAAHSMRGIFWLTTE